MQKHKIYDYSAANGFWEMIKEESSSDWSDYAVKYKPIFDQLERKLKSLTTHCSFYTRRSCQETFNEHIRSLQKKKGVQIFNEELDSD